jgi:hypothetical protein
MDNGQHLPGDIDDADPTSVQRRPANEATLTSNDQPPPKEPASGAVNVPARAATLTQWARVWATMCADGTLVAGPINDDALARASYNLSAKQLRNIRNAAVTGALRRRANELGVQLPAGYIDHPAHRRTNGHQFVDGAH